MLELYYIPGACSLATHIVALETGLPIQLHRVPKDRRIPGHDPEDFRKLHHKGYVPALRIDGTEVLSECAVILRYLSDRAPEAHLGAEPQSLASYQLDAWLVYIATEIHKHLSPILHRRFDAPTASRWLELISPRLTYIDTVLQQHPYLTGTNFRIADAYLFAVLRWSYGLRIDLTPWHALSTYMQRLFLRPSVQRAMQAEGLHVPTFKTPLPETTSHQA